MSTERLYLGPDYENELPLMIWKDRYNYNKRNLSIIYVYEFDNHFNQLEDESISLFHPFPSRLKYKNYMVYSN